MRLIGIGASGDRAGQRQARSGGRKLPALVARNLAVADLATSNAAACNVSDQFEQMAVLHLFNAVGKNDKPAIDLIEFAPLKLVSQLFAPQSQRVAAGVLAQHQPRIRHAHRLRRHDFVGQRILEHAILVNSGLVQTHFGR